MSVDSTSGIRKQDATRVISSVAGSYLGLSSFRQLHIEVSHAYIESPGTLLDGSVILDSVEAESLFLFLGRGPT